jgi:PAS domain S-box-containing protein
LSTEFEKQQQVQAGRGDQAANSRPGPDASTSPELAQARAELSRLKQLYAIMSRAGEAAVRVREPLALYERVCRVLVDEKLALMAWVGIVEAASKAVRPVAHWGRDDGFLEATRHSALEIPQGLGPTGVATREGRADICLNIAGEIRMSPWQQAARERGYVSCTSFPLMLEGQPVGALTLYGDREDTFDAAANELVASLAEDVSFAIESFEKENLRRQAIGSLRSSEDYYRTLIENAQDIIAVIDERASIRYVSPAAERILKYKRSELRDRNVFEFVHPDDLERLTKLHGELLAVPGSSRHAEARLRHKNGTYHYLDLVGQSCVDSAGDLTLVINARDATERKAIDEAQRKDRDFISAVINTTDALVVVFDQDAHIILFNRTAEQATGYTFAEVRGRTPELLVAPGETEEVKHYFARFLAGDPAHRKLEIHWATRHGANRLIALSSTVMAADSTSSSFIICTGTDITEHRQAEQALRESEAQYRTIFESTGTAMCIIAKDARVTFMNQEFERMTGYGAPEVEGVKLFAEFLVPDDVESFSSYHRETRRSRSDAPVHFECRIIDKANNMLNVLANMGSMPGQGVSVVSLIDVTRERSYEKDLAQTAERLRHFLTVASHELRHPITIVKGYANTLSGFIDEMPREHVLEILKDIDASTDRLTRYVEELMDVSRVEEGRFPVRTESVDTDVLIKMTLEDMQVMGSDREFVTRVSPEVRNIDVDPEKFVQLLVILLENAIKFSPASCLVEIELTRQGTRLEGAVLDRGRGISENDRPKVFDRFYQVEDTMHHSTPGMGLGLYIAHEIVTAHGGSIWAEGREGGGSVFKFSLPLEREVPEEAAT